MPPVVYISYNGATEPLGQSQIVPYLERLSEHADITLISFEGPDADLAGLRARLDRSGIGWLPLVRHSRPPVVSTLRDAIAGRRTLARALADTDGALIHVRSYVPALIALRQVRRGRARLLFDIRGLWADERVDAGLWPRQGVLYRITKAYERRFFAAADSVVTLSEASVPTLRRWLPDADTPVSVIPTCVDVDRFTRHEARPGGPHAVWTGSISTWYRFDLAVRLARELGLGFTVLTRETEGVRDELDGVAADVRTVAPADMPQELFSGDIGLCLIRSTYSKLASMPTRFAEFLAAGMPVAVTPGVGDLERLVEDHRVGVVVRSEEPAALAAAARELLELAADEEARERCRALARSRFDVDAGAREYLSLYRRAGAART